MHQKQNQFLIGTSSKGGKKIPYANLENINHKST
jgi:hypothetical protein